MCSSITFIVTWFFQFKMFLDRERILEIDGKVNCELVFKVEETFFKKRIPSILNRNQLKYLNKYF